MKQIVFTKYSAERSREFAIRTDITRDSNGCLAVEKHGLYPEGRQHIHNIYQWYQCLQKEYDTQQFLVNCCEEIPDGVKLEYLTGETLQQKIEKLRENGKEKEIEAYILQYLERMTGKKKWKTFEVTEEFTRVFGEVSLPEGLKCQSVTNIDMIFSNILVENGTWHFIDYEWTFDFPIPIHFVLYRAFFLAASEISGVRCLDFTQRMSQLGIGVQEQQAYQRMETHFQEYVRGKEKPIRDMIAEIGQRAIPMSKIVSAFEKEGLPEMAVVYDTGTKESGQPELLEPEMTGEGTARIIFPAQKSGREAELQISSGSCLVQIKKLLYIEDRGETKECTVSGLNANGMDLGGGLYVFLSERAWIRIPSGQTGQTELILQIQELPLGLNQRFVQQISELYGSRTALQEENYRLVDRYRRVESSRLFRFYQKLRELYGKMRKKA